MKILYTIILLLFFFVFFVVSSQILFRKPIIENYETPEYIFGYHRASGDEIHTEFGINESDPIEIAPYMPSCEHSCSIYIERCNSYADLDCPTFDSCLDECKGNKPIFSPIHKLELKDAIDGWVTNPRVAENTFGHISTWDTNGITDMSHLFEGHALFNDDISSWDTSNVRNMNAMFKNASSFNQYINSWNTGNVTTTAGMFQNTIFNNDLNSWDVSKVTNMTSMFENSSFNQNLNHWNTSSVTNMEAMFKNNRVFNGNITSWIVTSCSNFKYMFYECSEFNQNVGEWYRHDQRLLNIASFTKMFYNCTAFQYGPEVLDQWYNIRYNNRHTVFTDDALFDNMWRSVDVWKPHQYEITLIEHPSNWAMFARLENISGAIYISGGNWNQQWRWYRENKPPFETFKWTIIETNKNDTQISFVIRLNNWNGSTQSGNNGLVFTDTPLTIKIFDKNTNRTEIQSVQWEQKNETSSDNTRYWQLTTSVVFSI